MLQLNQFKPISSIPDKEYIYGHTQAGHIQLTPIEIGGKQHWQATHMEKKAIIGSGTSRGQALYNAVQSLNDTLNKGLGSDQIIDWGF